MSQVRLIDASYSKASEVLTRLIRSSQFTVELGDAICNGNEDRAVSAMRRELLPEFVVASDGNGGPYRSSGGQQLPPDHYLVPVTYAALPSFADLEREYGKDNVSDLFDGRPFQKHASCEGMDETPGDRVFLVKHFGRNTTSEANIAEMDKLGYRPATHLEAYAFAKAQPELQRQFWIVALGSFVLGEDGRCVALMNGDSGRRLSSSYWSPRRWGSDFRFLFVRKHQ